MYGKVLSACVQGIDGQLIDVEVDVSNGLPMMTIVGLPDSAIRESMERVRAAIRNCGCEFPLQRITVNLAPADVRKEGSAFDLAIAAGILRTSGQLSAERLSDALVIGELALNGELRPVPGVLSMVHRAAQSGIRRVLLPIANAEEASLIEGIDVYPLTSLSELIRNEDGNGRTMAPFINGVNHSGHEPKSDLGSSLLDYVDVRGQLHAKRALMIAAAGMHNILLVGPPGTGKTMLARRLPTILPDMSQAESLEVTKIYSVASKLPDRSSFLRQRPFRAPHHSISTAGLIGGGSLPKPGEVSLAHRGVLFLDELPEFTRPSLEVLRQPLEDRRVTIGRARAVLTFPAQFMLAASMNPCPCGYYGADSTSQSCTCSLLKRQQYRARLSGPLLDRIDLHIEVPRLEYEQISGKENGLSSFAMKEAVDRVHRLQLSRYEGTSVRFNGELAGRMLREQCALQQEAAELLERTFQALGLSIRAHDRILKIARTIADLERSEQIEVPHLAEAIQYRVLDRDRTGAAD